MHQLTNVLHAVLALALSTALSTAAATETTVNTSTYDATSTSTDIDISCTSLDASSSGTVSGKCNKTGSDSTVSAVDTSLDVTSNIRCGMSNAHLTAIAWGTGSNQYWSPKKWDVVLNSTGDKYLIEAVCTSTYGVEANASTLELGDSTNGVDNSSGSLSF